MTTTTRPFIKTANTTMSMMFLVLLSLLPAAGAGIYHYGLHAALLIVVSLVSAVGFELLFELCLHRPVTIADYSAAVSGMVLGLILPPSAPLYFPVIGSAVGILLCKMLPGGIGKNLLNPALAGKLVLVLAFREQMNDFSANGISMLTPLTQLAAGNTISPGDMLTGRVAADIGTGCTLAVLAAALFLLLTGISDLMIPAGCFLSFTLLMILLGRHGWNPVFLAAQYMGGSFLFTVFIMAQDHTTRPLTRKGRFLYGLGLGAAIAALRLLGYVEDAAVFALVAMNLTVPLFDAYTMPRPFGIRQSRMETMRIRRRRRRAVPRKGRAHIDAADDGAMAQDIMEPDIMEPDGMEPDMTEQ